MGLKNSPPTFQRLIELVLRDLHWTKCVIYFIKCHFCKASVRHMAPVVSKDGLALHPAHSQRVRNWPTLKSATEVRAFLGLCSYYRRFVQDYAFKAQLLHRLTHKDVRFEWNNECSAVFLQLKEALTSPPLMAFPNFDQTFILSTDASNTVIGAILSQI